MRILLLLLILFSFSLKAQLNPTDACGTGVQALTVGSSCTANSYTLNGSYANGGQVIPTCTNLGSGNDRDDGWYKFVATSSATTIQLTGDENHVLAVYTGSCGTGELGCDQAGAGNTATVTVPTTSGTTYYIQVYRRTGTNTATMTGTICLFTATISAGDYCSNAISLTPGASCSPTAGNTNTGYTASGAGCTTGTPDDDIWYSFVATATSQVVTVDASSDMDAVLGVYTSCAATTSPTGGSCVDATGTDGIETVLVSGLTIGTTYYVKVHDYYSGGGNFTICVTNPPTAPANDNCTGATSLTVNPDLNCGTTTAGTVYGATASSQTNGCSGTADDDVWYSFVATSTTHSVTISNVSGSVTDMYHSVYGGTCGSPGTALVCSDPNSSLLSGLTVGATYFVRVYTYTASSNQTTTFNICIGTPPAPPSNDNCSGATSLTSSASCVTTAGDLTWATASTAPAGSCFGTPDHDVWYSFVAAATTHTITVNPNFDSYIQLYSGTCASLTSLQCSDPSTMVATGLTVGTTYYIRVYYYYSGGPSDGTFTICVTHCPSAPANDNCSGAVSLTVNSGSTCTSTTAGTLNCATSSGVGVGSCFGNPDDDVWYSFVATGATHNFTLTTASGFDAYMQLFSGTCGSLTSIQCSDPDAFTYSSLTAGTTYYLRVYSYSAGNPTNGSFTICVNNPCPTGAPANDNCSGAVSLTVNSGGTCAFTTAGTLNCATSSGVGVGSCFGNPDDDVWYSFVATGSTHDFTLTTASGFDAYMQLFSGTCGSLTSIQCSDPNSFTNSALTAGTTYYLRVYSYNAGNPTNGSFTVCVNNPCPSGAPANDLPCAAVSIPIGTIASGDNSCSGSAGEPATPGCWTSGNRNTVWFSFVAPAGGGVKIKTAPGSLTNTQIAVYQGTCGAGMTMVASACNDDAAACGGTSQYISELTLSGLTAGTTYRIAVDGSADLTGTFAITVINSSSSYPTSSGQECSTTIPVCASSLSVGNPGYQGIGFTCDDTGTATDNCTSGERGSVWYAITIQNAGSLSFNIVPNDYTGTYGSETDYDFILWKLTGSGATTCAAIASSGGAGPVSCNFSADGVTGLSSTGNAPSPYSSSYDGAYESSITVAAGDVYALVVENYSNSTSGFTIDFSSTSSGVINYTPPTSVTWSGGNNSTTWTTSANWGGCTPPTCTIDGVVSPASTFQPTVTSAMGTVVVKNLTIDPGATLTLGPNSVIQICESLTNNGTIIADPTSTILFSDNNTAHALNGTLSGTSSLGNLVITDAAGSTNCTVTANTDIQLKGNFTTSNATSIFNLNSRILTLAGNFSNASAATTFTGVTSSTVIFNGTTAQTYSPGGALPLNNVTMSHTGTGVSITTSGTPNMIIGTSGVLTLTSGKIITPGSQQVEVRNTANAAVSTGNTSSFVQGNLLRYLAAGATGSFDFPVGDATKGYQRANLNFTTAASASASQLLARFDPWGGAWSQPGAPGWGPECAATYNQPFLDNGYWSIDVASGTSTGSYNITLYNTNYTNAAAGFSVGKSVSAAPAWNISNGTCVGGCPVTAVQRNSMSGFSKFATIQSSVVLPVQLLSFTGQSKGSYNELKWVTVSEENLDHFELQSSVTDSDFKSIHSRKASGSSKSEISYGYSDYNYYSPLTYYRLKLSDKDGTVRYSTIIQLENQTKLLNVVSVFPNPAANEVNIGLEVPYSSEMQVEIRDVLGRLVASHTFSVKQGNQTVGINTESLSQGSYIISCKLENLPVVNNRLIIKK
jgi:hypothetical protein